MSIIILILYGTALLLIFVYSIMQMTLVISYKKGIKEQHKQSIALLDLHKTNIPLITIQLPVYNELYVVERLIDTIAMFNYPNDKFEIQVLDDSTDESIQITADKVTEIKERGIDIKHIQRKDRIGFKAGALDYGLKMAKGEFIVIFDADFIPDQDFLLKTIPYFEDDKIGVVQTRWGHINKNYSLLTRLQAFGLDAPPRFAIINGIETDAII